MGIAILKIKVMPEQDADLEKLKEEIEKKVKKIEGNLVKIEEEEVAFGLKSLIVMITWPEEKETGIVESALSEIKGVSSLDVIDYRRALG